MKYERARYCIVLYFLPVLNPKSYDGARVLEASGRPMLVKSKIEGQLGGNEIRKNKIEGQGGRT